MNEVDRDEAEGLPHTMDVIVTETSVGKDGRIAAAVVGALVGPPLPKMTDGSPIAILEVTIARLHVRVRVRLPKDIGLEYIARLDTALREQVRQAAHEARYAMQGA